MDVDEQKIIVSKDDNPGFKLNPLLSKTEQESIISQGAEGRLFRSHLWGQECVIKERFKKEYRVPALDEKLTKTRMLQEVKSMARVRKAGVLTPALYLVDIADRKIYMEYLGDHALTLKDFIRELDDLYHPAMRVLVKMIGLNLALMHKSDNIHGDLTTSNMMIRPNLKLHQLMSQNE